jgi:hypothetical protein
MRRVSFIICVVFLVLASYLISTGEMTIEEVLSKNTKELMSIPGVVGTAQGLCNRVPCIKILVIEKTAEIIRQIPTTLEGYKVEIIETGEIRAHD